mgnify:CR=1 FL=1
MQTKKVRTIGHQDFYRLAKLADGCREDILKAGTWKDAAALLTQRAAAIGFTLVVSEAMAKGACKAAEIRTDLRRRVSQKVLNAGKEEKRIAIRAIGKLYEAAGVPLPDEFRPLLEKARKPLPEVNGTH